VQLRAKLGDSAADRLGFLEGHRALVLERDDATVELAALYNETGQPQKALDLLTSRSFHPWEGGEGQALGQHVRSELALGRAALARREFTCAVKHFQLALTSPENLSEAKHLLANQSDIHFWLGVALKQTGDDAGAKRHWLEAANFRGDFQDMAVRAFSEMTYYSALAWQKLGQKARATQLLRDLLAYAKQVQKTESKIDYFATSLPTMLLFNEDPQFRQETGALFLQAQAQLELAQRTAAAHRCQRRRAQVGERGVRRVKRQ
jgi:tetratricopeptide (TPR) repeat protein